MGGGHFLESPMLPRPPNEKGKSNFAHLLYLGAQPFGFLPQKDHVLVRS